MNKNSLYYKLDKDGQPIPVDHLMDLVKLFEDNDLRRVGWDVINGNTISTVFLAINHNFGEGPPILWETMIFGGKHDQYQQRYSSLEEAKKGHAEAIALVKEEQEQEQEKFDTDVKRSISLDE